MLWRSIAAMTRKDLGGPAHSHGGGVGRKGRGRTSLKKDVKGKYSGEKPQTKNRSIKSYHHEEYSNSEKQSAYRKGEKERNHRG